MSMTYALLKNYRWVITVNEGSCQRITLGESTFMHDRTGKIIIVDNKSLSITGKYCSVRLFMMCRKLLFMLYQETTMKKQLKN
jgi:hypothetical protein